MISSPRPYMSMDEDFNLSESLGDVTLEFTEVHNKKMSELSSARFFWKIEGVDPYLGGLLKWDTPYKIKHFSTGKYLRVMNFGNVNNEKSTFRVNIFYSYKPSLRCLLEQLQFGALNRGRSKLSLYLCSFGEPAYKQREVQNVYIKGKFLSDPA